MNNNKHRSIDFMFNRAISVLPIDAFYARQRLKETYEQAKAMHKEEIEEAYDDAIMKGRHQDGYEYYEQTFGDNKWAINKAWKQ